MYNDTITALNAAQKLHFHCVHKISWEWDVNQSKTWLCKEEVFLL